MEQRNFLFSLFIETVPPAWLHLRTGRRLRSLLDFHYKRDVMAKVFIIWKSYHTIKMSLFGKNRLPITVKIID